MVENLDEQAAGDQALATALLADVGNPAVNNELYSQLFVGFGNMGSMGEFLQEIMQIFAKVFGVENLFPGHDDFKALGKDLADAAAQENPKEAVQQTLDSFVDQNAEKLGISSAEKDAMKAELQEKMDHFDEAGMDWNAVAADLKGLLHDDVAPVTKVEGEGIEYGEPAAIEDAAFHGESVGVYSMDANGNFEVSGMMSVADLKTELGEGAQVQIVKVEAQDLAAGGEVTENRGYYVSNEAGAGYYLDTSALDLASMDAGLVSSMDEVYDPPAPAAAVPGMAPELQNTASVSGPSVSMGGV